MDETALDPDIVGEYVKETSDKPQYSKQQKEAYQKQKKEEFNKLSESDKKKVQEEKKQKRKQQKEEKKKKFDALPEEEQNKIKEKRKEKRKEKKEKKKEEKKKDESKYDSKEEEKKKKKKKEEEEEKKKKEEEKKKKEEEKKKKKKEDKKKKDEKKKEDKKKKDEKKKEKKEKKVKIKFWLTGSFNEGKSESFFKDTRDKIDKVMEDYEKEHTQENTIKFLKYLSASSLKYKNARIFTTELLSIFKTIGSLKDQDKIFFNLYPGIGTIEAAIKRTPSLHVNKLVRLYYKDINSNNNSDYVPNSTENKLFEIVTGNQHTSKNMKNFKSEETKEFGIYHMMFRYGETSVNAMYCLKEFLSHGKSKLVVVTIPSKRKSLLTMAITEMKVTNPDKIIIVNCGFYRRIYSFHVEGNINMNSIATNLQSAIKSHHAELFKEFNKSQENKPGDKKKKAKEPKGDKIYAFIPSFKKKK